MKGIDVSSHDYFDLRTGKYKADTEACYQHSDFVIIKASEGTSYTNPAYKAQADRVIRSGKCLGFYHYASGYNAIDEARYFWEKVKAYAGKALFALDFESYGNKAWNDRSWARKFSDEFKRLSGIYPLIYVQASAIDRVKNCADVCPLWVAGYPNNRATWDVPTYPYGSWYSVWNSSYTIWQFTSSNDKTDRNTTSLTAAQWREMAKSGRKPTTGGNASSTSGTAADVLRVAGGEVGYSRWSDPQAGTKYGRWYAQSHSSYYGTNGVPYCAMFVSWVFARAGVKCAGLPEAYCPSILNTARRAGLVVDKHSARAGDIVLFDWDGGEVDHVGIVTSNEGSYLKTIEGNTSDGSSGSQTNGGRVARKNRPFEYVKAVVRPQYKSGTSSSTHKPTASTNKAPAHMRSISVDGFAGPNTIRLAQRLLKTPIDGVVSGQYTGNMRYVTCATRAAWVFSSRPTGSTMVKALQRKLGIEADGFWGRNTSIALQRKLHVEVDGIFGSNSCKAWQRKMNEGKIF